MSQIIGSASDGQTESGSPAADQEGADQEPSGRTDEAVRSYSHRSSTAELGGLILAFAFGALGFAVRIFWIPALVVMAVVFGLLLADRRTSKSSKGVVPEIIAGVVNEAREIYQAASVPLEGMPRARAKVNLTRRRHRRPSIPLRVESAGANGHSPIRRVDSSDAALPLTGESSKTHDESHDDADGVETESATEPSVDTGRAESHGSESIEPEHTDSDSNRSDEPPARRTNDRDNGTATSRSFHSFSGSMVARNPLLRPVRNARAGRSHIAEQNLRATERSSSR